jgi:hypothetical protein
LLKVNLLSSAVELLIVPESVKQITAIERKHSRF